LGWERPDFVHTDLFQLGETNSNFPEGKRKLAPGFPIFPQESNLGQCNQNRFKQRVPPSNYVYPTNGIETSSYMKHEIRESQETDREKQPKEKPLGTHRL